MIDNVDTDVDVLQTRYRAKRGQDTLNVELSLVTKTTFNSNSVNAATGGGGGAVGGTGVVTSITGGTSGGGAACPEVFQFILIRSDPSALIPTLVKYVEVGMYLWSPVSKNFEQVVYAEDLESELWEVSDHSISALGSPSHPLISLDDAKGVPLKDVTKGLGVPAFVGLKECCSTIQHIAHSGNGMVKKIETEGPTHVYCAGTHPEKMFWWHNLKPIQGDNNIF